MPIRSIYLRLTRHSNRRPRRQTAAKHPIAKWLVACAVSSAAVLSLSTGCGSTGTYGRSQVLDKAFLGFRDHVWANRAYNLQYRGQGRPFADHHRRGFIEGYCNVCNGGDGYTPALPPQDYWSFEYQSEEGARCVDAYFEGFPEGVAAARRMGAGDHRGITVSKMAEAAYELENSDKDLLESRGDALEGSLSPAEINARRSSRAFPRPPIPVLPPVIQSVSGGAFPPGN